MGCNCLKHLFLLLRVYLNSFIDLVFSFFWEKHERIPDLEERHQLLKESAVTLAKKIRNKELKSEHLVRICMERIKAVNKIINAVTDERFDGALQDAREVDRQIAEGLPDEYFNKKPFLGVPFTAKESHAVAGMLHTLGLVSRRHSRAPEDAECVRQLRDAGAIPIAVTNVPEINKWQESRNMLFGQTCNPYHTGRTPGGSSGGEAALMASLATPISLCSDIGGSTRMPAFFCGLFGHNPTAGTTSLKGSTLRSGQSPTMASIGFVSRHVQDLAPLIATVADRKKLNLDKQYDPKNIKYYYLESAGDLRVSPISEDLKLAMKKVIRALSADGSPIQSPSPVQHAGFDHMFSLWKYHMSKEADDFSALLTNNTGRANCIVELCKKLVGQSEFTLAAIYKLFDDQLLPTPNAEWAEKITKEMKDDLNSLLGSTGVLLLPSAPSPAPYHGTFFVRPFDFAYWGVVNALRLPATQVPLGLNSKGLPLGVQVVSAAHNDGLCLTVARRLHELFHGYVPPCKV